MANVEVTAAIDNEDSQCGGWVGVEGRGYPLPTNTALYMLSELQRSSNEYTDLGDANGQCTAV